MFLKSDLSEPTQQSYLNTRDTVISVQEWGENAHIYHYF